MIIPPQLSALAALKSGVRVESLVVLADDGDAVSFLAAALNFPVTFEDRALTSKDDIGTPDFLFDLWDRSSGLDLNMISIITGVEFAKVLRLYDRLRVSRLLFPDGSMAPDAERIVRAVISGRIRKALPPG